MKQSLPVVLVVLGAALVAAGCGGAPEIKDVKSCLAGIDLRVESAEKTDKKVEEGVFATSDLGSGDASDITIAVAARVKKEDTVQDFERDNKSFAEQLGKSERGAALKVESGTDGRYVWVVMGDAEQERFREARDCVQP